MQNLKLSPRLAVIASFCATALAACSGGAKGGSSAVAAQSAPSAPKPAVTAPAADTAPVGPVAVATLKELMDSTVDPAADGIWEAVVVRSTRKGVEYHQPRTPEEWAAVRRDAVALIEAMNLVVMPGRRAAPANTKPGLGELEPAQIERAIGAKRALFVSF